MALFISFEGPDGSGKSTQVRLLSQALREQGHAVLETREPGGTPLGERLRDVILSPESPAATPVAMTFLLSAARAEHVAQVIEPALKNDQIVITDRFADSTIAYQCFGLGMDLEATRQITFIATGGLDPDVVIYVDVPADVGLVRVGHRGTLNRLDRQTLEFHRRVRDGYLHLAAEEPDRWIKVDGMPAAEVVHDCVMQALQPRLPQGNHRT